MSMEAARNVTAIVLAGGRSSRFGRDKLGEPIDGRTLLDRAVAAVDPVAREILVVTRPGSAPALPDGTVIVEDPVAFQGPLVGLLAGLRAATRPAVLVVGGDMPTMARAVLEALLAGLDDPSVDAVVLGDGGRGRPLPGALRAAPALAAAERLVAAGERRLRAIYEALPTRVIDEPAWRTLDPEGLTLRDVDSPADLS
jgi:molybdopterin-guanine dinucleotide biosynthesis protein A